MKTYSAIFATVFACLPVMAGEYRSVAEFTPEEPEKLDWSIVDDGVMGGLSQGKVPFNRFVGSWRGTELPDKVFDPAKIRRIGLQLAAKEAGKLRIEGKEYVIKDGDVIEFRFNVSK